MTFNNRKKPLRLITIPISHYCEKARWALTRLQIPFVEERHMPPFHLLATSRVGGKLTPVLITENNAFTDSTDILRYIDGIAPANAKLYPTEPNLRSQVEELEDLFNEKLGSAVRRWGYFCVMDDRKLMQKNWCDGVPFIEQALFPVVFPFMQKLLQQRFNLTPESATQAKEEINRIFEKVSELLADGRTYLVGDSLSAADITFAALAAPAVAPPEHPMKRGTDLQALSPKAVSDINAFRETRAGEFALSLYRNQR
jgi:glutathione S-transferase